MGGNLLGCSCLRYLLRAKNIKVLMVVGCYHDNGSVIEPRVWNASLARLALNKNLPFIQPKSPRNLQFINDIQNLDRPDLIITVEYDKILDTFDAFKKRPQECIKHLEQMGFSYGQSKTAVYKYRVKKNLIKT